MSKRSVTEPDLSLLEAGVLNSAPSVIDEATRLAYIRDMNRAADKFHLSRPDLEGFRPADIHAFNRLYAELPRAMQAGGDVYRLPIIDMKQTYGGLVNKYAPIIKAGNFMGRAMPVIGNGLMLYDIGSGIKHRLENFNELAQPRNDPDLNKNGY